jgi:hypothetical protein
MSRRLARLVAVAALAAATTPLAGWGSPASAAVCAEAGGVSVVVDFRELGGGLQATCDASGGDRSAADLFTGNGFPLTYVQRQPGFVCRVSGLPAEDPCVNTPPATAYWGLYWSNGTTGSWSYSSVAAGSLTIPAGGSVAFAWQGQSQGPPGVAPPSLGGSSPTPTPSPTPTKSPSPTKSPTKAPTKTPTTAPTETPPTETPPTTPSPTVTATPTPGSASPRSTSTPAPPSPSATRSAKAPRPSSPATDEQSPSASPDATTTPPSASPSVTTEATEPASSAEDGSVPLSLVIAVLGLLGALVAGASVLRRRRGTGGG